MGNCQCVCLKRKEESKGINDEVEINDDNLKDVINNPDIWTNICLTENNKLSSLDKDVFPKINSNKNLVIKKNIELTVIKK